MTKLYKLFLLVLFSTLNFLNTQAQQHIWSKSIGNLSYDQFCSGMALDKLNNVIITGNYVGAIDLGGGFSLPTSDLNDVFLIKHNKDGSLLWAKGFGTKGIQTGEDVVTDQNNNIIIVGNFEDSINFGGTTLKSKGSQDIFLAKFDAAGNHLWSKSFGDLNYHQITKVAVDAAGNIYFTGGFDGSVNFGDGLLVSNGENDIFLARFDSDGNVQWSKKFGNLSDQIATGLAIDANSNVLLSGEFYNTVDFGGGVLTSAGGGASFRDVFLAKFTSLGNHIWSARYGDAGSQFQSNVTTDKDNNIIFSGAFSGTISFGANLLTSKGSYDMFLVKLDPNGTSIWAKSFGANNNDFITDVVTDAADNVYFTGYFPSSIDLGNGVMQTAGNLDILLAKFDTNGNYIWAKNFGNAGEQKGKNIAVDEQGNFFASGTHKAAVSFDGQNYLITNGYNRVYLVRFDHFKPEIVVRKNADIIKNTGTYYFGNIATGNTSGPVVFTIENIATGPLNLSGNPIINISGANAGDFSIDQTATATTVAPGTATTFTITYTPTAAGKREALITIENDDEDESPFTFTVTGNGPEINLKQGAMSINTNDTYGFNNIAMGNNSGAITFTIENTGGDTLKLTDNPVISINGNNDFTVDQTLSDTIVLPGASTTFALTFTPAAAGARTATISIANNDADENPYIIHLTGNDAEINIKQNGIDIPNQSGFSFGNVNVGGNKNITFTIENTGSGALNLSGNPKIMVGGTNKDEFLLDETATSSTIAGGNSTTFSVNFSPLSSGAKTAYILIANGDFDENPYIFSLAGNATVPAPEIQVRFNNTLVPSYGGNYNLGKIVVGNSGNVYSFNIDNLGNADLHLTTDPKIGVFSFYPEDFIITQTNILPSIPGLGTTSFTIQFIPTGVGVRSATIYIISDDADEPNYQFIVQGEGIMPEIEVRQGITEIPDFTGTYNFGKATVGSISNKIDFSINNLGNAPLHLTNPNKIVITGTNATDFIISQSNTLSTIAAGSYTAFGIQFNPTGAGIRTATITIANDDTDEKPYQFIVYGEGVIEIPEIGIQQGVTNLADKDVFSFGEGPVGNTKGALTFILINNGTANLEITNLAISGDNASDFVLDQTALESSLAPGTITTFTIAFTPASEGNKSATLAVQSNDPAVSTYFINLQGKGTIPNGIASSTIDNILISPNPSTGKFQVFIPETNGQEIEITVNNIIGQKVWQSKTKNSSSYFTLDLSDKPKGIYFLELRIAEKSKSAKLIVK